MNHYAFWVLILVGILATVSLRADECTHLWEHDLHTEPFKPKSLSGDTHASYGVTAWKHQKDLRLELRGKVPKARFWSVETGETVFNFRTDTKTGNQIQSDLDGNYVINIVPTSYKGHLPNLMRVKGGPLAHGIFYREYLPETPTVLPRIFAYELSTGEPSRCPALKKSSLTLDLPQFLVGFASWFLGDMKFRKGVGLPGTNVAIPAYYFALGKGKQFEVKIKVPTKEQALYWSLCTQNFVKNITLACVADTDVKPDEQGYVTVHIHNQTIEGTPVTPIYVTPGHIWMPDNRPADQTVMGFVYRNIMPAKGFTPYEGEYLPVGRVVSE